MILFIHHLKTLEWGRSMDTEHQHRVARLAVARGMLAEDRLEQALARHGEMPLLDWLIAQGWLTTQQRGEAEQLLAQATVITPPPEPPAAASTPGPAAAESARQALAFLREAADDLPRRDRYVLETDEPSGKGGMGQVWRAHDEHLGRTVALKEMHAELLSHDELRRRFLVEAQVTSQLQHPGIVPIYEMAEGDKDGKPYYTMRFVEGKTLSEAIHQYHEKRRTGTESPVELRDLLTSFVAVCNTLAYAHAQGVIHRDLKSANVVLGSFGEVVVLDWGLARVLRDNADEKSGTPVWLDDDPESRPDVKGTLAYMAPEQARGEMDRVDRRSDVFGLGAILYEILTGRPPYEGDNAPALYRQATEGRVASVRASAPWMPRPLSAVCMKALATRPEDRYTGAMELGADIKRWLSGEAVDAWQEPWTVRAQRWGRRHRVLVTSSIIGLILISLFTGIGLPLLMRAQQEAEFQKWESWSGELRRLLARAEWSELLEKVEEAQRSGFPDEVQLGLIKYKALEALSRSVESAQVIETLHSRQHLGRHRPEVNLWFGERLLLKGTTKQGRESIELALKEGLPPADSEFAEALLAPTVPAAAAHLRQSLLFDPLHQEALRFYLATLFLQGNRKEAAVWTEVAQHVYPQDKNIPLIFAFLAAADGKHEECQKQLERWRALVPPEQASRIDTLPVAIGEYLSHLMDHWTDALSPEDERKLLAVFRQLMPAVDEAGLPFFRFPPALSGLVEEILSNPLARVMPGLAGNQKGLLDQAMEVIPDGLITFIKAEREGVAKAEAAERAEKLALQAAQQPSMAANVDREAYYFAMMAAAGRYVHSLQEHPAEAPDHLKRAVSHAKRRLSFGKLRSDHAARVYRVTRRAQEFDLAEQVCAQMLAESPDHLDWLANGAETAIRRHSYELALKRCESILAVKPQDFVARRYRSEAVLGLHASICKSDALDADTAKLALDYKVAEVLEHADQAVAVPKPSNDALYYAAYVHALAAAADIGQKEEHLKRSLDLLSKLYAAGYFADELNLRMAQGERGFALLRTNPEFTRLIPK